MKAKRVNPAVYAGLMAQAAWFAPRTAYGVAPGQDIDLTTALVPFAAGLGTGIALAGTISAIAWHHSKKSIEAESIAHAEESWFGTDTDSGYVPQHLCAPGEVPTGFVPASDETDDSASGTMPLETARERSYRASGPQSFAQAPIRTDSDDVPRISQNASESAERASQEASAPSARSFAAKVPDPAVSSSPDETTVFLQAAQQKEEAAQHAPRHGGASGGAHATEDYGDIATNYVQRLTWAERMGQRARGVRDVLSERLGMDQMDDLPVIKRADGTVGDVGTDWWERAVGKDISREFTIPVADDYSVVQPAIDDVPFQASVRASQQTFAAAARPMPDRSQIASRIATIDDALYPEQQEGDGGADKDALWASALEALDEKDPAPEAEPAFPEVVAPAAPADEDDVYEEPTATIPFRRPGGHPEVIDTESYVDYLVEDEIAKNPAFTSDHDYLKVIDGGNGKAAPSGAAKKSRMKRLRPRGSKGASANEA